MKDLSLLDEKITGRVQPRIYAFTTNTIPNYLKVGDTYRSVSVRLEEWKEYFPSLKKQFEETATISPDIFFRDHSIHQYLETELHKVRLLPGDISKELYYSNEFFKETTTDNIIDAIKDIKFDFDKKTQKYRFYNAIDKLPEIPYYERGDVWLLRPNQADAVNNFEKAVKNGRKNLLMYAVMRFGKSFTSLCCATKINAKFVLIVSAKADVKTEWKKTVQSAGNFRDYIFVSTDELKYNENIIKETLKKTTSPNRVVVFLTLQDLQGDVIKEKHIDVFSNNIDLLIVDETHFGARAEKYGQVLQTNGYENDVKNKKDDDDFIEISSAEEYIKYLNANIKLHLSGTPYRILMGSEFAKEDVITFCQFTDIVKSKKDWDKQYLKYDPKAKKEWNEWDNPYYGFPKMVRFAFNPNESSIKKMEEMKKNGITYAFSALFKPMSIKKDEKGLHKKFVNEKEILDLLEVIDGSKEDKNLLSFLDYAKIKTGKMCRHIVIVLPYCASCDALEILIKKNLKKFKNLKDYNIINISGIDNPNFYKKVEDVKRTIREFENQDKKTITLTVNRMLTGSTVEQWDTMLYFKDTSSPQEYDQAIFRLQNQYIKNYKDKNGDTIKYNMKPQTLLVDFDPNRMFFMQEQKSLIYNVNTDEGGNTKLKQRLEDELGISPIIVLNKDKFELVKPTDILEAVNDYSKNRGVAEEASEVPVDLSLMNIEKIRQVIENEHEIGSKNGINAKANQGEGTEQDIPDENSVPTEVVGMDNDIHSSEDANNKKESLEKKFRMYYARILFFAFLSNDELISIESIINFINTPNNIRIAKNIGINKEILILIKKYINKFALSKLDYKIQNINRLSHEKSLDPLERSNVAIKKFGKLGESEVVTPPTICKDMVDLLPDKALKDIIKNRHKILDIAGKAGEFAIALCKKYNSLGYDVKQIKNVIYTIPTSSVTYEFTRKIYEILGLDISCIAEKFTSYDILDIKMPNGKEIDYDKISSILTQNKQFNTITMGDVPSKGVEKVKFDAIVGNPPYQRKDAGAGPSATPIYHFFIALSKKLDPSYVSIIMPTRWFSGGKKLNDFREEMLNDSHIKELHDFLTPEQIFPDTNNRGGVCYYLWDKNYNNKVSLVRVVTYEKEKILSDIKRSMKTDELNIFIRDAYAPKIINKVLNLEKNKDKVMSQYIESRKPFGIEGYFVKDKNFILKNNNSSELITCYGKGQKKGLVSSDIVLKHKQWINIWKVFIPRANNIGTELNDDNLNAFVGKPMTVCTESYLIVGASLGLKSASANNLTKYFKTKFVRYMHSLAKTSHDCSPKTFRFVPLQDFTDKSDIDWNKSIPEIDKQLYKKYGLAKEEIEVIESMIKPMD